MKNEYKIIGDVTEIYVNLKGKRYAALIDTEDLAKVKGSTKYTYYGHRKSCCIYPTARKEKIEGKLINVVLHRVIMNFPEGMMVDHINGNTLDNRKQNLRVCDVITNNRNRRKRYME